MITTHGVADFRVAHQPDRVRITIDQQERRMVIALPAKAAMELARAITDSAVLAMTEEP